jgi:D-glycero-alpha-D-manno-heptose-7-phosphate kinase
MIEVSLPARINVVGSPTDAVEGAYATISAAVQMRGGARIGAATDVEFQRPAGQRGVFPRGRILDPHGFDVEAAAVNALLRHSAEFAERLNERGVAVRTWTDIPASSGLAGSSVLVLAVLAALRAFYDLDARRHNDYVLAEIAQRAEEQEMGVVCGFADRYVPLFGDVAYLNYHGKLWHAPLGEEPFVTYERLGDRVPLLQFCVATTGVQRDSGSVHAPMRARYLAERRRGAGPLVDLGRRLGETAWRGKIALLAGDLESFGGHIRRNQELIDEMMRLCGFPAGAGKEVGVLLEAAHAAGALGAKLTGAGGGGAIFALPPAGGAQQLAGALRAAAARAGLAGSAVFVVPIDRAGLRVTGDTSACR